MEFMANGLFSSFARIAVFGKERALGSEPLDRPFSAMVGIEEAVVQSVFTALPELETPGAEPLAQERLSRVDAGV